MDDTSPNNNTSLIPSTQNRLGFFSRPRTVVLFNRIERILNALSPGERLALYALTTILTISVFMLIIRLSDLVSVSVPTHGGTLVEGEVGSLRFVNPVLALSQPDQDATALVYSGLLHAEPNGALVSDIASSYTLSSDGLTYTFVLRPNVQFHDNTPVTSEDVAYTIGLIQDPALKSPRRGDWVGVRVSTPDTHTVVFTLPEPYAPFIANATVGILPKHLWGTISDEEFAFSPLNTQAIGSGPFMVSHISKDSTGTITRYDVGAFSGAVLGKPYLDMISLVMYADDASAHKALSDGIISSLVGVPSPSLKIQSDEITVSLPRVFGVFFNQNHNITLADISVRKALSEAINPSSIVRSVLNNHATAVDGPIPANTQQTSIRMSRKKVGATLLTKQAPLSTTDELVQNAQTILKNAGWSMSTTTLGWIKNKKTLSLTLATADTPELVAIAQTIATAWRDVGVHVLVTIYPVSELQNAIIKPRAYDAILFGEAVGPQLDLYAFWHSKERNDPGLNLAMYANSQVDSWLTQARATTSAATRDMLYKQVVTTIHNDTPAVFLYSPNFSYIIPESLQGVTLGSLTTPADRFQDVYSWYMKTERVWTIFAPYVR